MSQSQSNMDVLSNPETIKVLANVLKCNVSACTSIGTFFSPQIVRIYLDMLSLYRAVSEVISETVAAEGLIATKTPKIRGLRTIKKEILKLMDTHIRRAEDLQGLADTLLPPLLEAILGDYNRNIPAARDAEVLNVVTTIVTRLGVRPFPDPVQLPQGQRLMISARRAVARQRQDQRHPRVGL